MNKAIIIFGPTGVGKSAFADKLAHCIPVEIINMDIGSFYAPLTIGTAKPDWRSCSVLHHLFDIIETPQDFTVTEYRRRVQTLAHEIWERGNIPLLVGGSGFYLKSLFFPPVSKQEGQAECSEEKTRDLWQELNRVDPLRAQQIHPHDLYRIKRALAIWKSTGQLPTDFRPVYDPLFTDCYLLYITRDRQDLYARIDKRVDQMLHQGLVEEAQALYAQDRWKQFLRRKKIIGYNDLFDFFESEQTDQELHHAVRQIQQRTRAYAKRQEIFWRMLKKEFNTVTTKNANIHIQSINVTHDDVDLYIKQIKDYISTQR